MRQRRKRRERGGRKEEGNGGRRRIHYFQTHLNFHTLPLVKLIIFFFDPKVPALMTKSALPNQHLPSDFSSAFELKHPELSPPASSTRGQAAGSEGSLSTGPLVVPNKALGRGDPPEAPAGFGEGGACTLGNLRPWKTWKSP